MLFLNEDQREPSIEFNCKAIHIDGSDIGLQFMAIVDIDSYIHFKNLMISNSREPEKLIKELNKNPGIIIDSD